MRPMRMQARVLGLGIAAAILTTAGCAAGTSDAAGSGTGSGSGSGSTGAAAATSSGGAALFTQASSYAQPASDALVQKAKGEGGELVWYESTPDAQVAPVLQAFQKKYPFVHVTHVKLAGSTLASRVAQESQAGAATADVATDDAASNLTLEQKGFVQKIDWSSLSLPKELTPNDYEAVTAAVLYAILYNKDQVTGSDIPTGWDDLVSGKWKGKLGTWVQPFPFAELVPAWGADKTSAYVQKFVAQSPTTYQDTFPLAQAVGAGEVPVALGIYHSAQPAIAAGAPIGVNVPDPAAATLLYSIVPNKAKHPATAQLFINWLSTQDGATAYEQATYRGNPLLPGTKTGELIKGKQLSDYGPDQAAQLVTYAKQFAAAFPR